MHAHVCTKDEVGIFIGAGCLLGILLVFVGNDPLFTDERGGTELRQLDTTGVNAAKTQLELIEFQ